MHWYDVSEESYKNGYKNGAIEFAKYLKSQSFFCDPDDRFSFQAIDVDDLDDFLEEFLGDKI